MIDVCICTHNPRQTTLERTLKALIEQTVSKDRFSLVIIDNLSRPALSSQKYIVNLLNETGLNYRIISEKTLGIAHARVRALRESKAPYVVFVDDDNILASDFLEQVFNIFEIHRDVGCFSGKILLPDDVRPPSWTQPLLGSLAIKNCGELPIIDWFSGSWLPWHPTATASMVLKREVIDHFLKTHATRNKFFRFGRKGKNGLSSGEDFFIALSAIGAGYKCGYFPQLKMFHNIAQDRFDFLYLVRLMANYATTELDREEYLGKPLNPFEGNELYHRLKLSGFDKSSFFANVCNEAYQISYIIGKSLRLARTGRPVFRGKLRWE